MVETATDNNQRTVANVRSYFNKHGGSLGTSGSLSFLFDHKGVFHLSPAMPTWRNLNSTSWTSTPKSRPKRRSGWSMELSSSSPISRNSLRRRVWRLSAEFERIPNDYKDVTPEQREAVEKTPRPHRG